MKAKLSAQDRLKLIKRALNGEPVAQLCREANISRIIFYRWLKRYKEEGHNGLEAGKAGRPSQKSLSQPQKTAEIPELSPLARSKMIDEVVLQGARPSEVAEKYQVSRVTLYKWLNRYKQAQAAGKEENFVPLKPHIERYFRQTPEKHEQAVLSLAAQHPEFGVRSLVSNLPKVGGVPIVGHHGVQNILRRNNLSTYQQRIAFSQAQVTPTVKAVGGVLERFSRFFALPTLQKEKIIHISGITFLSAFATIIVFGLGSFIAKSFVGFEGVSSVGLFFAILALSMGSIFFFYSLKYYLTLAIVLSFSQTEGESNLEGRPGKRGFWAWLLGIKGSSESISGQNKAVGLEPNLEHVTLKRYPYISIQIPFYNEKNVVERAIAAATNFDYQGEYEVILADDSTDETTTIIENYFARCKSQVIKRNEGEYTYAEVKVRPGVTLKHIHRLTRDGFKGKALSIALKESSPKTEFISIFDADFVPYPDSLELFLKYFKVKNQMSEDYTNSNVAAVQGYQWHVLNKSENWITRGVRSEYAGSYVIERSGTEIYGGLKQISGSVYMIRKQCLQDVGWGTSITEDFELTLRLYEKGYKVVYTPYVQAPAECVSTLKRLVRQRMRWAEGHSHNIKRMFFKILFNPKLTFTEKMEFLYLSPYYLQAFFFLVGTVAWFISEAVIPAHLPFWTALWGWSLVLTNILALPLMNSVGLFLEESEEKDYVGLASFIVLSYLLVPFQAYASVKGFWETSEGPWFRTPKTGKITDIFTRGQFYRLISGVVPGFKPTAQVVEERVATMMSPYLSLSTANNRFDQFEIAKSKRLPWVGKLVLSLLLCFSTTLLFFTRNIQVAYATNISGPLKLDIGNDLAGGTWPSWGNYLNNTATYNSGGQIFIFRNNTANSATNNFTWYTKMLPTGATNGYVPSGTYYLQIAKSGNSGFANQTIGVRMQLLLTNNNGTNRSQIVQGGFLIRINNAQNTLFQYSVGSLGSNSTISTALPRRLSFRFWWNNSGNAASNMNFVIDNSSLTARLIIPAAIGVPEVPKLVIFVILVGFSPVIPSMVAQIVEKRKRRDRDRGGGWKDMFDQFFDNLTGRKDMVLDELPV